MFLVTGGAGLIGSEVADRLTDRGEHVTVYDLDPPADPPEGVTAVEGDVADRDALSAALVDADADRLVHLAAVIGRATNDAPTIGTHVNVVGTDNAFAAAEAAGLDRVVWTSTHSVYGVRANYADGEAVPEDVTPPAAFSAYPDQSYYAAMKQLNEYQSRLYADRGLDARAVRPSFVFGPARARGWKGTLIADALAGEAHIPHPPDAHINFVYVADVADLVVRLLTGEPSHHVYNTGGHTLAMADIADTVESVTGGTVTWDPAGDRHSVPPRYDYERARSDLGYELTPYPDCVRDYVDRVS